MKKEIKGKNEEIGKLNSQIEELKQEQGENKEISEYLQRMQVKLETV